jgi:hypothetical protein
MINPLVKKCKTKPLLDLHDARPAPTEPGADRHRPIGIRDGRRASLIWLPRDFGLAEDRRGKAGKKTLLTWLLVDPAAASRKPRPKVVAAPTDAMFLLAEAPRHLEGTWGGPRHTNKGNN